MNETKFEINLPLSLEEKIKSKTLENLELTEKMKDLILDRWEADQDPPSLLDLVRLCWTDEERKDEKIKLIKNFLATMNLKPKNNQRLPDIILTEEQMEFIRNHAPKMSSALEISKQLFPDKKLTQFHKEVICVRNYLKSLPSAVVNTDIQKYEKDVPQEERYSPPNQLTQICKRVNEYCDGILDYNKLNVNDKKNLNSLINQLHNLRFLTIINSYDKQSDRDLFESSYIRYVWDKADDLTNEEVDQYVMLASDVVTLINIQKRKESLQKLLDKSVSKSNDGEERIQMSMTLAESIGKIQQEYNECHKRQQDLYKTLTGKRSERIKDKIGKNASLINLIEFWQTYENRQRMIVMAEIRKKALKDEINRVETLDSMIIEIFGATSEEILNS